ncbi:3-deoxy-7-phosphoheptulonate synthase [Hahella aquimaris]|uniref:3-deoxy-7-phosphoheptulonate synthase n=1 Tax=Hahella sp. HNIBRBA332 TaxID=3015983 RepID=UPI00273AEDB2|nr:3-deoxy-7-phosphoheptulonate synthase [Hahella sp. HNIBRBA332]WLQ13911.1 3-deoxy-7-phosphoheptulonate synthase [Hahella sp. HNIBRBA332]
MNQAATVKESGVKSMGIKARAVIDETLKHMEPPIQPMGDILPSANQLRHRYPVNAYLATQLESARTAINNIVHGDDPRLLVVVGPCSVHDTDGVLEYGRRLAELKPQLDDRMQIVMRAYVEKPRTTVGWKGLVYDPLLDGSHHMAYGLDKARRLMVELAHLGLPLATEALSPIVSDYLQDLVSWTAIGARTTESQLHREMASGLTSTVGFKNGTDGGVEVAIQAMQSSRSPHCYPTLSTCGRPQMRKTLGNPHVHLVLRGGRGKPNYDEDSVREYSEALEKHGLPVRLMVDCSHDNSRKDFRNQSKVLNEVARQLKTGSSTIMGVMLESYLQEGTQKVHPDRPLQYGVSITDGCIGWDETERLLTELYEQLPAK